MGEALSGIVSDKALLPGGSLGTRDMAEKIALKRKLDDTKANYLEAVGLGFYVRLRMQLELGTWKAQVSRASICLVFSHLRLQVPKSESDGTPNAERVVWLKDVPNLAFQSLLCDFRVRSICACLCATWHSGIPSGFRNGASRTRSTSSRQAQGERRTRRARNCLNSTNLTE